MRCCSLDTLAASRPDFGTSTSGLCTFQAPTTGRSCLVAFLQGRSPLTHCRADRAQVCPHSAPGGPQNMSCSPRISCQSRMCRYGPADHTLSPRCRSYAEQMYCGTCVWQQTVHVPAAFSSFRFQPETIQRQTLCVTGCSVCDSWTFLVFLCPPARR